MEFYQDYESNSSIVLFDLRIALLLRWVATASSASSPAVNQASSELRRSRYSVNDERP